MVVLFDKFNLPEEVLDVIFATKQQKIVATELIKFIVKNKCSIGKVDMSLFATQLHDGTFETTIEEEPYKGKKVRISYNRRQFYDRILTPMKSMGMIDYDLYKKTYSISEHFNAEMIRIGIMWVAYLNKLKAQTQ
ncbi:MAG: hypothetical protein V1837_02480 [Candidatus Woesearchaeota archaeon]